jgi:hypothetical protein
MKVGKQTLQNNENIWTGKACIKFLQPKTLDSRQKQRNIHRGEQQQKKIRQDKIIKEEMLGARYSLNWRLRQKLRNISFNGSLGTLLETWKSDSRTCPGVRGIEKDEAWSSKRWR